MSICAKFHAFVPICAIRIFFDLTALTIWGSNWNNKAQGTFAKQQKFDSKVETTIFLTRHFLRSKACVLPFLHDFL